MKIVIDANILMSALIRPIGKTCELIFNDKLELLAPNYIFEEIHRHKKEISEKSGLSDEDFNNFLNIISTRISLFYFENFKNFMKEALVASPDENDSEYFALAMKFGCPIWSNDKRIKLQDKVRVIDNCVAYMTCFLQFSICLTASSCNLTCAVIHISTEEVVKMTLYGPFCKL